MVKPRIKLDPAYEKLVEIKRNRPQYFRYTRHNTPFIVMTTFVIPMALGYVLYHTEGKWQLRGKLRGDDLRDF